jgi:glycosyltransferase involved in cell wall biosynthesis
MKASLITTILNEKDTIDEFMKSVISQTKKPDEFIIVDGGSTDGTYEILKKYSKKYKWIKVFQEKGDSIGRGRNIAIEKSKNEIIACTDAGCILDKNWLKEITRPFEKKDVDVVVGIYKPYYTNDFEYFQGLLVVSPPEKIFMNTSRMSSRSIAFKKMCWEKVGGYPNLTTGEDTQFNIKLMEYGFKFYFAKNAIVYWRMRKNLKDVFKQFYRYGVGDRKSRNILKMGKNLLFTLGFWFYVFLFLSSFFISIKLFEILLSLPFLYFFLEGLRLAVRSKKMIGILYGFLITLTKRVAYALGVSFGK